MWKVSLLSGFFLFLLGFFIKIFNMSYLIAGYNTSSKKEKEKYDEKKLVNFVGYLLMISSVILILGGFLSIFLIQFQQSITLISWILFTLVLVAGVIYVNLSRCVMKDKRKLY